MTPRRVLRWPSSPRVTALAHPYRDTALFHAGLAGVIVLVAWASAGSVGKALVVAAAYFVAATSWSWWRVRQRRGTVRKAGAGS